MKRIEFFELNYVFYDCFEVLIDVTLNFSFEFYFILFEKTNIKKMKNFQTKRTKITLYFKPFESNSVFKSSLLFSSIFIFSSFSFLIEQL